MDPDATRERSRAVLDEVSRAVVAEREVLETILTGLLARGHVLLEDLPGTGKTLTARSFATALGLSFSRIQFTPDLLPADVTGSHVFDEESRAFEFRPGPLFDNVVLADEINRASPKTQAALLEAMEERQVTVGDETYELPRPFFVIATQNPIEQEGTFVLPEAQKDRFLVKTSLGYPDLEGELELVDRRANREEPTPSVSSVCDADAVRALQRAPEDVHVASEVRRYVVDVVRATREHGRIEAGVSPRGTQRLFEVARARAALRGREYVLPDDVKSIAPDVLAHRLTLTADARVESVGPEAIVRNVLEEVRVPSIQ